MRAGALTVSQHPFLLPVAGGDCFCVYREPVDLQVTAGILHLPAFGDEMNKSRAMTARAARAFAALGYGVLQIDLWGCGDSSGGHDEAFFDCWIDNLRAAMDWLRSTCRTEGVPVLWCLRGGALLAPPLLGDWRDAPLVLWNPVLSGKQQLGQVLRQKLAGELADSGTSGGGTKALRDDLRRGATVEIGGYGISSRLADDLDRATLDLPVAYAGKISWFEVGALPEASLFPASRAKVESWRASGVDVKAASIAGPGFWQSAEIERCDAVIDASVTALVPRDSSTADEIPRDSNHL